MLGEALQVIAENRLEHDFERHFADGLTRDALRRAPCVNFNEKDELQKRFVKRVSRADIEPPAHVVPHGEGFVRIAMVENEQRIRQAARGVRRFLESGIETLHNVVPLANRR